ncbi:MAG: YicC family protein [Desulfobulbaceae bacterium]|nr:YicC family protein [Desulfobulbaceae bacterium]
MNYPLSMTAFGRGEQVSDAGGWVVELRSLNHRFCDVRIKMPRQYTMLEEKIKREVTRFYSRGHVEVVITPPADIVDTKNLNVNLPLARQYHNCLLELKEELHFNSAESELSLVANYPNVITANDEHEDLDLVWDMLSKALQQSLDFAQDMREREGISLKKDLLARLDFLSTTKERIEEKIPQFTLQKQQTLQERIGKLTEGIDLDPDRIAQEIAIIADKADVTEELVRLTSHIEQFRHFLEKQEPVGRRLDFLLQEFLREINTMASKISDVGVAHQAVELKNEVEKMREQVQNLE